VKHDFSINNNQSILASLDLIHAKHDKNLNADNFKNNYQKSAVKFRQNDNSAPYVFVVKRIGYPNFLQRSDMLKKVCTSLEEQRIELIKEARRFWINNHETILQIEFFDNTGLAYNRVGFTRRTFSSEGKPVGVKVWKKKNCDFWNE